MGIGNSKALKDPTGAYRRINAALASGASEEEINGIIARNYPQYKNYRNMRRILDVGSAPMSSGEAAQEQAGVGPAFPMRGQQQPSIYAHDTPVQTAQAESRQQAGIGPAFPVRPAMSKLEASLEEGRTLSREQQLLQRAETAMNSGADELVVDNAVYQATGGKYPTFYHLQREYAPGKAEAFLAGAIEASGAELVPYMMGVDPIVDNRRSQLAQDYHKGYYVGGAAAAIAADLILGPKTSLGRIPLALPLLGKGKAVGTVVKETGKLAAKGSRLAGRGVKEGGRLAAEGGGRTVARLSGSVVDQRTVTRAGRAAQGLQETSGRLAKEALERIARIKDATPLLKQADEALRLPFDEFAAKLTTMGDDGVAAVRYQFVNNIKDSIERVNVRELLTPRGRKMMTEVFDPQTTAEVQRVLARYHAGEITKQAVKKALPWLGLAGGAEATGILDLLG